MNFVPVRTSTLRHDIRLGFDVYLLISDKHLLYIKSDDSIASNQLERLSAKNVRTLFIDDKDLGAYKAFLDGSRKSALTDPKMPKETVAMILNGQAKAAVEEMFANPESKENYLNTESAARSQVEALKKNPATLEHMLKIAQNDKTTYQHSVNVANIAIGLAQALGAPDDACKVIGTGALLHDIGRGSETDSTNYQQHPRLGAGILSGKKHIPRDVLDVILFHEERLDGKGFPAGVRKLDQIFQVVGLANLYDRQVTILGKKPREGYEIIQAMDPPPYDEDLIKALKDVLVAVKIY